MVVTYKAGRPSTHRLSSKIDLYYRKQKTARRTFLDRAISRLFKKVPTCQVCYTLQSAFIFCSLTALLNWPKILFNFFREASLSVESGMT